MKILCWNVENALKRLAELPAQVAGYDVVCLQELRVRAQDPENVAALERALPGYCCFHALPRDPHNVTYRGGRAYGVATYVRGDATGEQPAWDREGRVVVVRTRGLAIVNVYAVNGTSKPYLDEAGRPAGDDARGYTWFNPRSRALDAARVDYFRVSDDVDVRDAALLPRHRGLSSDHAPLTLDVAPGSAG